MHQGLTGFFGFGGPGGGGLPLVSVFRKWHERSRCLPRRRWFASCINWYNLAPWSVFFFMNSSCGCGHSGSAGGGDFIGGGCLYGTDREDVASRERGLSSLSRARSCAVHHRCMSSRVTPPVICFASNAMYAAVPGLYGFGCGFFGQCEKLTRLRGRSTCVPAQTLHASYSLFQHSSG